MSYTIKGKFYDGEQIRFPSEGSCVDDFLMGTKSTDTNGRNINLLSGVVRDLIKQVDLLKGEINSQKTPTICEN